MSPSRSASGNESAIGVRGRKCSARSIAVARAGVPAPTRVSVSASAPTAAFAVRRTGEPSGGRIAEGGEKALGEYLTLVFFPVD